MYSPLAEKSIKSLKVGDEVSLSGVIYTARDLAHQELSDAVRHNRKLPICLRDQVIYYCGPTPRQKDRVIGSCGPTTSSRMDDFTLDLLKVGLKGMIGKGPRSPQVRAAIKKYKAVYFLAIGGCGALLSTRVKKARVVAYKKFGPEAIYRLEVEDFPLIVGIDSAGRDIYKRKAG
ncbi:MAG: fumarate hydratase C-terminal domain-containing protein [Candidatus Omnitrophota bacterium]|nr:MAG: fumarate hydratase C-terminal domain-containing protein [Candidatus Omnitrophota bacterium]